MAIGRQFPLEHSHLAWLVGRPCWKCISILLLLAAGALAQTDAQYICANGNDANNGQSWNTCKRTLHAALAALPTTTQLGHPTPRSIGTIFVGSGTFPLTSTLTILGPFVNIIGMGHNLTTIEVTFNSPGDGIRIYDPDFSTNKAPGPTLEGFSIRQDNATENTSMIHFGDFGAGAIEDVAIFCNSAGLAGLWMDNTVGWTERTLLERVDIGACLKNIRFTNSGSSANVSFEYTKMLDVHLEASTQNGQTGEALAVEANSYLLHSFLNIGINGFSQPKTFVHVYSSGQLSDTFMFLMTEDNGAGDAAGGTVVQVDPGGTFIPLGWSQNFVGTSGTVMTNNIQGFSQTELPYIYPGSSIYMQTESPATSTGNVSSGILGLKASCWTESGNLGITGGLQLLVGSGTDAPSFLTLSNGSCNGGMPFIRLGNTVQAQRITTELQSALAPSDFTLAGWGASANIGSISGTDQNFTAVVTSGSAPHAFFYANSTNPTITLKFHDGAWPAAPNGGCWMMSGGTGVPQLLLTAWTPTALTITYNGTISLGTSQTYPISCVVMGR